MKYIRILIDIYEHSYQFKGMQSDINHNVTRDDDDMQSLVEDIDVHDEHLSWEITELDDK